MAYLGGKTLFLPDIEILNLDDKEAVRSYLRVIHDILEELNRRTYELTEQTTSLFLATISTSIGSGWYNTSAVVRFNYDGTTTAVTAASDTVLNVVDQYHEVQGLIAGDKVWCKRITDSGTSPAKYVGVELFGRTTIGLCA